MQEEANRFIKLDVDLLEFPDISLKAKIVFSIIESYKSEKKKFYASNAYLSDMLKLSRSTVINLINELVEAGLLKRVFDEGTRILVPSKDWRNIIQNKMITPCKIYTGGVKSTRGGSKI